MAKRKTRGSGLESRVLEMLRRAGGFVSGQAISERLGVTRAAVWKHIDALRTAGFEIRSVTNKGYKLVASPDLLRADEIASGLSTDCIGREVVYYDETTSTNDRAKELAAAGAAEGTTVVAGRQTAGRGRLGRTWLSEGAGGVCASVILRPDAPAADVARITLVAGLAACAAIRSITRAEALIKWPNDVVMDGRKVCGILAEMSGSPERIDHLVVGIGINVNEEAFPAELADRATSLRIETGESYSRKTLLHGVLSNLEKYYRRFCEGPAGAAAVLDEYRALCATLGSAVTAEGRDGKLEGVAEAVDSAGGLAIRTADGRVVIVQAGEVSVRGMLGYA